MAGLRIDREAAFTCGRDRIVDDLDIGGGTGGEWRNYSGAGSRTERFEFAQHSGAQLWRCAFERGDYYWRDRDWGDRMALGGSGVGLGDRIVGAVVEHRDFAGLGAHSARGAAERDWN